MNWKPTPLIWRPFDNKTIVQQFILKFPQIWTLQCPRPRAPHQASWSLTLGPQWHSTPNCPFNWKALGSQIPTPMSGPPPSQIRGMANKMSVVSSRTSNESSSNLFQLCTSKIHMQILNILLVNISVNGPYLCVGMYNPPPFSERKQHTLSWSTAMNLSPKTALLNNTPPGALALSKLDKNQIAPYRSRKNTLIFQKTPSFNFSENSSIQTPEI